MKNNYPFIYLLLAALFSTATAWAQWNPLGPTPFSPGQVNCTSLALGVNDTPYVAFLDKAHHDAVSVMKYNGSSWDSVGNLGFSNTVKVVANEISLVLKVDQTGKPYVFYQDSTAPPFSVMTYNGTGWVYLNNAGISVPQATPTGLAMALDQSGTPYIGYMDYGATYKASVLKYTAGNWVNAGPANFTQAGADYLSLVIDKMDTPWVAFSDGSSTGMATVEKYTNAGWAVIGGKGLSFPDLVSSTSLAFDDTNNAYIAYADGVAANGNKATVKELTDSGWLAVGDSLFTTGAAQYLTMQVSPQALLCVAFSDGGIPSTNANVDYFDGTYWDVYGQGDFSTGRADWVSFAIGHTGIPYVAFVDEGNSSGASAYRDIYTAGIRGINSLSGLSVYPNPNNGRFQVSIQSDLQQDVQIGLYDMLGRAVWQESPVSVSGSYTATISVAGLPQGIYALQVKSQDGVQSKMIEVR
jgi:hypothetical protein